MKTVFIVGCGAAGLTEEVRKLANEKVGADVILVDVDNTSSEKLKELGMPTKPNTSPFEPAPIPFTNPYAELEPLINTFSNRLDNDRPWKQRFHKRSKKHR